MIYFWIVIALVILIYIIYRARRGTTRYCAVQNAFLGKYTYDRLTKDQQKQVHEQTEDLRRRGGRGMSLSDMADMLKFSFYALGMAELDIPPALPGEKWAYVRNPFLALHGAESQMSHVKYQLENKHKVNIDLKTPAEALDEMFDENSSKST